MNRQQTAAVRRAALAHSVYTRKFDQAEQARRERRLALITANELGVSINDLAAALGQTRQNIRRLLETR